MKMNSQRKGGFFTRKKTQKTEHNWGTVQDGKLGRSDKAKSINVPDLSISLPFTHCKIVLRLDDDKETTRNGWTKEGEDFIFYDSITSRDKMEMAMSLHESISSSKSRSSKSTGAKTTKLCGFPESECSSRQDPADSSSVPKDNDLERTLDHSEMATTPNNLNNIDDVKERVPVCPIFRCPYCLLQFSEAGALIEHLRDHMGNKMTKVRNDQTISPTSQVSLSGNLTSQPPQAIAVKEKRKLPHIVKGREWGYSCTSGKILDCLDEMNTEAIQTSGSLLSPKDTSEIEIHENIEIVESSETGKNQWRCKLCAKILSTRDATSRHIRTVHMKEWRFRCMKCSRTFFQKSDFMLHAKIHSGAKSFRCELCSKAFLHQKDVVRHMTCHSRMKLYECSVCRKSFVWASALKRHIKGIHTDAVSQSD